METIIGLNLSHSNTCLFTKTVGGEGLPALKKFLTETLQDGVHLVTLRLEDRKSSKSRTYFNSGAERYRGVSVRYNERLLADDERDTIQR